jgi:hypothetical protein
MTIILNSDILNDMKKNDIIKLEKKYQKNSDNYNFYIHPNISIRLYNAKVIDISTNHIVFQYKKIDFLNLMIFLKNLNEHILKLYKESDSYDNKMIYNLYNENEETFTIRCYLPHNKFKYFISHYQEEKSLYFNLPKKGSIFDEIIIDIRNLWINNNKVGFNLELKQTKYY